MTTTTETLREALREACDAVEHHGVQSTHWQRKVAEWRALAFGSADSGIEGPRSVDEILTGDALTWASMPRRQMAAEHELLRRQLLTAREQISVLVARLRTLTTEAAAGTGGVVEPGPPTTDRTFLMDALYEWVDAYDARLAEVRLSMSENPRANMRIGSAVEKLLRVARENRGAWRGAKP